MVTCDQCGGSNFECDDGFFFCLDCNTQSQTVREVVDAGEYLELSQAVIKTGVKIVEKKSTVKKVETDVGRVWNTYEGFNIILCEQVKALIKLGAPKQLKDVVLQIWAFYLSKVKGGFVNGDKDFKPELPAFPRDRDINYSKNNKNPVVKSEFKEINVKRVISPEKSNEDDFVFCLENNDSQSKDIESESTSKSNMFGRRHSERLKNKELYKESQKCVSKETDSESDLSSEIDRLDNGKTSKKKKVLKKRNSSVSEEMDSESDLLSHFDTLENGKTSKKKKGFKKRKKSSSKNQKFLRAKTQRNMNETPKKNSRAKKIFVDNPVRSDFAIYKSAERIDLGSLICLLYIGLNYLNSSILLCDLLRWINEGIIPYMNAVSFFPSDMMLCTHDIKTFCPTFFPKTSEVRKKTGLIIKFLELDNFPYIDLPCIIHRFILELNLPSEMHSLTINLLKVQPPVYKMGLKNKFKKPPCPEIRAMAFIILTLKFLFGLDDSIELWHSHLAENINKTLKTDKFFVWSQWVRHITVRHHLIRSHAYNGKYISSAGDASLQSLLTYDKNVASQWKSASLYTKDNERWNKCQMSFIQPLTMIVENRMESSPNLPNPSSFPNLMFLKNFLKDKLCQNQLPKQNLELLTRNFSCQSMKFLTHQKKFIDEMKKLRITVIEGTNEKQFRPQKSQIPEFILYYPKNNIFLLEAEHKRSESLNWLITICGDIIEQTFTDMVDEIAFIEKILLKKAGVYPYKLFRGLY